MSVKRPLFSINICFLIKKRKKIIHFQKLSLSYQFFFRYSAKYIFPRIYFTKSFHLEQKSTETSQIAFQVGKTNANLWIGIESFETAWRVLKLRFVSVKMRFLVFCLVFGLKFDGIRSLVFGIRHWVLWAWHCLV